jgi:hypothetical protein
MARHWPARYFSGLTPTQRAVRENELRRRKSFKLGKSNQWAGRKRKSSWTVLFHKVYPGLKFNKTLISKRTGIPVRVLDTVYNRGRRAWQTSGSRPGVTAEQWGIARLYKFVLISKHKAARPKSIDPDNNLRPIKARGRPPRSLMRRGG